MSGKSLAVVIYVNNIESICASITLDKEHKSLLDVILIVRRHEIVYRKPISPIYHDAGRHRNITQGHIKWWLTYGYQ